MFDTRIVRDDLFHMGLSSVEHRRGDPEVWVEYVRDDRYEVSSHGRIRSFYDNRRNRRPEPKILKQTTNPVHGYAMISFGRKSKRSVHSVICEAFHGPKPKGMECAHGDGVRLNNFAWNLSWKTCSQNNKDKRLHGTQPMGETSTSSLLTEADVRFIRSNSGVRVRDLADATGVSRGAVYHVLKRETWAHVA
jgi:hypothetical protein